MGSARHFNHYYFLTQRRLRNAASLLFACIIAATGVYFISSSHAQAPYASVEAESGTLSGGATTGSDSLASGSSYVRFAGGSSGNSLCGWKAGTPQINKVLIIWEENEEYPNIIGNNGDPYINNIATSCANATNYYAYTNPSLPNYMAMTSGQSYAKSPWDTDCSPTDSGCTTSTASIFSQLGSNWKAFAESMISNCENGDNGEYAVRHNPATYYKNIASACSAQDVPLGTATSGNFKTAISNGLPALTTVTPNLIDDMHDGTLQDADSWLSTWIPIITSGTDYQSGHLAILIAWDEGTSNNHTVVLGLSPWTKPGTQDDTAYNDYSVLRTMEDITGQQPLGNASSASSMVSGFGF